MCQSGESIKPEDKERYETRYKITTFPEEQANLN